MVSFGMNKLIPYCPDHGIRIHKNGFVYFNGISKVEHMLAALRNVIFNGDYLKYVLGSGQKLDSSRFSYESSEDAVTYNVFSELFVHKESLQRLVGHIINETVEDDVDLYLWGSKVDLEDRTYSLYRHLDFVRNHLEPEIKKYGTEPDIMLIIPKKLLICIEAKFGSKNPISTDTVDIPGEKPQTVKGLINRYCEKNDLIDMWKIFDRSKISHPVHMQIFRNIVFAATMAKMEGAKEWYVVNLRNQHVMNLKRGRPESMAVLRNVRSMLRPTSKKRFVHMTWEDIFDQIVKQDENLADLAWYMKMKSLNCGRAFNCF